MKKVVALLFLATVVAPFLPLAASAPVGIPILIDLSHGQPYKGIETMMKMVPEAQWYILVKSEEDIEALPSIVKELATDIFVGDFSTADIGSIEMIIIGQPQSLFTPEEISAIYAWFTKYPKRVIWVAADSDYPAQGSETSQKAVNMILEALGANLRMDYVSIEDPTSSAIKSYRVLGVLDNCEVPALKYGVSRVLFHGPGAVAWVDDAGNWHKLTATEKPADTYIIVTTTTDGVVVEHQAEPQGSSGKAYTPGETGVFTLMAAQFLPVGEGKGLVIVSSETPYGGYQPGVSWMYYGFRLGGPQFFRNVVLWATGYMGELSEIEELAGLEDKVTAALETKAKEIESAVNTKIAGLESKVAAVESKAASLESAVKKIPEQVNAQLAGLTGYIYAALGLGVVALILAAAALGLAIKKK